MDTKNILQSKTAWFNVALTLLTFVLSPSTPIIGAFVHDPSILAAVYGIGNVILRLISNGAVTVLPKA